MERLNPLEDYTWDFLIEKRMIIKDFADTLDVSQDYLIYQTDFLKAVTINNKINAINAINNVMRRIEELE